MSKTSLTGLVVEYINNLNKHNIAAQHFVQRFLIDVLLKSKNYHLLHHFIQYKVISDNKPNALQIHSISNLYSPASQIALDMLSRLQAYDTICELLLQKKEISHALQIMYKHSDKVKIRAKDILHAALELNDSVLFYNAYEILQKVNMKLSGKPDFDADCKPYEDEYQRQFFPKKLVLKESKKQNVASATPVGNK